MMAQAKARTPAPHQRRSIRLHGYDYTRNGAYFVTICAHERRNLFGHMVDDKIQLNALGLIVQEEWAQTAIVRPNIELDAFVVMPNHIHGIIVITDNTVGATRRVAQMDNDNVARAPRRVAQMDNDNVARAPRRVAQMDNDNVARAPRRVAQMDNDNVARASRRLAQMDNDNVARASRRLAPTDRPNGPASGSIGAIIAQYKSIVTKRIRRLPDAPGHPIWQRNYYEHIIRSEESLNQIRQYIVNNPSRWAEDSLYTAY